MKIGFLITARLKSTRLPQKLLLDLQGKTMIERVIDRCKQVRLIDEIVLCTSTNPQDRPLSEIALRNGIYYYLGDELDVVQRLSDAATFFNLDYVVNITGENPLFSIYHANLITEKIRNSHPDFVYINGLPIGCAVYGINANALKVICDIKTDIDTEIWGPLINQPEYFDITTIDVEGDYSYPNIRITSDYIEDYRLIERIYSELNDESIPDYFNMIDLLKRKPELLDINSMHKQAALSEEKIKNINEYFKKNNQRIKELKRKYYDF